MTDRYNYLTVGLEKDIRSDDAEALIAAIQMMKGVLKVEGNVTNAGDWINFERARSELGVKLWEILFPKSTK